MVEKRSCLQRLFPIPTAHSHPDKDGSGWLSPLETSRLNNSSLFSFQLKLLSEKHETGTDAPSLPCTGSVQGAHPGLVFVSPLPSWALQTLDRGRTWLT